MDKNRNKNYFWIKIEKINVLKKRKKNNFLDKNRKILTFRTNQTNYLFGQKSKNNFLDKNRKKNIFGKKY